MQVLLWVCRDDKEKDEEVNVDGCRLLWDPLSLNQNVIGYTLVRLCYLSFLAGYMHS
jgi:hypothetical protein